jgi:UPF0716 protein FxsA
MGYFFLFLFMGISIFEILVFISVGDLIGLWPTLATVFITAIIGTSLLRKQGLVTFFNAQKNFKGGRFPMEELFDGLCLILAGAFLLTPGFVTDGVGLLLFFQPFRDLLKKLVAGLLVARGNIHGYTGFNGPEKTRTDSSIIDGEYEKLCPKGLVVKADDKIKHVD